MNKIQVVICGVLSIGRFILQSPKLSVCFKFPDIGELALLNY